MTPRETFEDYCITQGITVPPEATCSNCSMITHAFALVKDTEHPDWVCGHCVIDTARIKEINAQPLLEEVWNHIKAQRNQLLEAYSWTIRSDSPLSSDCKSKFLLYLRALHRITVDNDDPNKVLFPEPPIFEYEIVSKG
jgi:hypothetical protein